MNDIQKISGEGSFNASDFAQFPPLSKDERTGLQNLYNRFQWFLMAWLGVGVVGLFLSFIAKVARWASEREIALLVVSYGVPFVILMMVWIAVGLGLLILAGPETDAQRKKYANQISRLSNAEIDAILALGNQVSDEAASAVKSEMLSRLRPNHAGTAQVAG